MTKRIITPELVSGFSRFLNREERSPATVEKYLRDVRGYAGYLGEAEASAQTAGAYKEHLKGMGYMPGSINSVLASLNAFFKYAGWRDCGTKRLRTQRRAYMPEERELKREEYFRLLNAGGGGTMGLVMETIGSTGIRVSELRFFTREAAERGEAEVTGKGKSRAVFLPGKLRRALLRYARARGITSGPIFLDKKGKPLSRGSVWAAMKRIAKRAGVAETKVFPHNLRKLFARVYYEISHDIAKLADLLGHSSIDTTRIYIMTSGAEHRRDIERMRMLI